MSCASSDAESKRLFCWKFPLLALSFLWEIRGKAARKYFLITHRLDFKTVSRFIVCITRFNLASVRNDDKVVSAIRNLPKIEEDFSYLQDYCFKKVCFQFDLSETKMLLI